MVPFVWIFHKLWNKFKGKFKVYPPDVNIFNSTKNSNSICYKMLSKKYIKIIIPVADPGALSHMRWGSFYFVKLVTK